MNNYKKWSTIVVIAILVSLFFNCDLGKSPQSLYKDGVAEMKKGKPSVAYKLFKKAAAKEPKNNDYQWAAASVSPNQNEAFVHTKAVWDNGMKNPLILFRLAAVAFHTSASQKMEYALSLYKELPDSLKSDNLRGELFFRFGRPDSALAVWRAISNLKPSTELSNKIAFCYEKKGQPDSMLIYLEQCRKNNLINSTGYLMLISLWAIKYDYAQADEVYKAAETSGFADNAFKIEYASILTAQNKFTDAFKLLNDVLVDDSIPGALKFKAVIMQTYIYGLMGDTVNLKSICEKITDSGDAGINEKEFCKYLLLKKTDTTGTLQKITKLCKSVSYDPYVTIVFINELIRAGRFSKADTIFKILPQVILVSPTVLVEYAFVKMKLGQDDEAMQLIGRLHQHHLFSRQSLELFRDLAFKKKMFEKSSAAQKLLEVKYKDDVSLQWSGAMMALNQGKNDSAIALFTILSKKHPSETQFETMRLTAIMVKGDYEKVVQECKTSTAPKGVVDLFLARALRKLGKIEDAKSAYKDALTNSKDGKFELSSEYAEYMLETGDKNGAASAFGDLVTNYEKDPKMNSTSLAAILNNYAWAGVQSGGVDEKTVVAAAKKAVSLQPENVQIIDTYAMILLKTGDFKDCISLLKDKKIVAKEAKLLTYLGQAYEKSGDINRAVRTYLDVIAFPDSIGTLTLEIDKIKLKEHVQTLQSQKTTH